MKLELTGLQDFTNFLKSYLYYPAYNSYPLVGITLEQAKKYTNWHTERVTEMLLIKQKKIKRIVDRSRDSHFTIERYMSGNFDWIIERSPSLLIPRYKIPSKAEWEFIAQGSSNNIFGIDSLKRKNIKCKNRNRFLFNTKKYHVASKNTSLNGVLGWSAFYSTAPCDAFCKNINGLYNTIGNVSEMIDKKGYSKGGSWQHTLEDSEIAKDNEFKQPNAWTGFRNVCSWENVNKET